MKLTKLDIYSLTDRGREREHNEDYHSFCASLSDAPRQWSFYSRELKDSTGSMGALLILADGMGGTNAGEVASKMAVEGIQQYFDTINEPPSSEKVGDILRSAIVSSNHELIRHQKSHPETRNMGTTLVLGWVLGNKLYLSWVGDSRAYCYHLDTGLFQLSKDHSMVQEMVDRGELTPEQAFYHPQSNIITQSMGEEKRMPVPGFVEYNIQHGDRILLCSDGLNGMIQDFEIEGILNSINDIETCGKQLIASANDAGGSDNITIILCDVLLVDALERNWVQHKSLTNNRDDVPVAKTTSKKLSRRTLGIYLSLALLVGMLAGGAILYQFGNFAGKKDAQTDIENINNGSIPENGSDDSVKHALDNNESGNFQTTTQPTNPATRQQPSPPAQTGTPSTDSGQKPEDADKTTPPTGQPRVPPALNRITKPSENQQKPDSIKESPAENP